MTLRGGYIAPRSYRPAGIKCLEMIGVVLTDAAYDALASTLPKGAGAVGPCSAIGTQSFIQVKAAVIDHMWAVRPRSPTS
jgi:hypothetical protein